MDIDVDTLSFYLPRISSLLNPQRRGLGVFLVLRASAKTCIFIGPSVDMFLKAQNLRQRLGLVLHHRCEISTTTLFERQVHHNVVPCCLS